MVNFTAIVGNLRLWRVPLAGEKQNKRDFFRDFAPHFGDFFRILEGVKGDFFQKSPFRFCFF